MYQITPVDYRLKTLRDTLLYCIQLRYSLLPHLPLHLIALFAGNIACRPVNMVSKWQAD